MTIVGDGSQKRDFTYIDDVVSANICAMNASVDKVFHNVYNVGTGKNHSIVDVASMIGVDCKSIPSRPAEVQETLADIDKTIKDLGWKPKYTLIKKINSY